MKNEITKESIENLGNNLVFPFEIDSLKVEDTLDNTELLISNVHSNHNSNITHDTIKSTYVGNVLIPVIIPDFKDTFNNIVI